MALRTRKSAAPPGAVPPPISVRRLCPGDDAVLAHLAEHNSRFGALDERPDLEPLSQAEAVAFLADDRTATLVAFAGDEPVGFCYANEMYRRHSALRHLCVYELAVAEHYRGQGIGAALLDAVGDHARSRGITRGFSVAPATDQSAESLFKASGAIAHGDEVVYAFSWDI